MKLDLLGLPPTPQEVDAFLDDSRSDAYERLVEKFLASPHFGERWGRHWLDLARYADSSGYESDKPRSIWRYRDWVINAINADMPLSMRLLMLSQSKPWRLAQPVNTWGTGMLFAIQSVPYAKASAKPSVNTGCGLSLRIW